MNNIKEENLKEFNKIAQKFKKNSNYRKIKAQKAIKKINEIEEILDSNQENKNLDEMLNNI